MKSVGAAQPEGFSCTRCGVPLNPSWGSVTLILGGGATRDVPKLAQKTKCQNLPIENGQHRQEKKVRKEIFREEKSSLASLFNLLVFYFTLLF